MHAMILAAGLGTRMRPLTYHIPKPLVRVCGTPMISRLINQLSDAGVQQFSINVGHLGQAIIDFIQGQPQFSSLTFNWYREDPNQLLGTAMPIARALSDFKGNQFWLISSDIVTDFDFVPPKMQSLAHLFCVNALLDSDFNLDNKYISAQSPNVSYSGIGYFDPEFFTGLTKIRVNLGQWIKHQLNTQSVQGSLISSELYENVGDIPTLLRVSNKISYYKKTRDCK